MNIVPPWTSMLKPRPPSAGFHHQPLWGVAAALGGSPKSATASNNSLGNMLKIPGVSIDTSPFIRALMCSPFRPTARAGDSAARLGFAVTREWDHGCPEHIRVDHHDEGVRGRPLSGAVDRPWPGGFCALAVVILGAVSWHMHRWTSLRPPSDCHPGDSATKR